MALGRSRILVQGDTPYAHEREGIEFIEQALPNNDPYHVWELIELLEPSTGRQYEIDLIVLGYSAIYLVEIKSGPGRYTGDSLDWYRHPPGQNARYMDPPLKSTNHKCKVLKSMLERRMPAGRRVPRIEPLVFLSHEDVQLDLRADGMVGVVTRDNVRDALTRHQFPGAPPNWRGTRIDAPTMRDVVTAAKAVGLRERKGRHRVGPYELGEVLRDGEGYQDHLATHTDLQGVRRRARVYLVPQQTSVERRKQLLRAAEREATLLIDVRGSRYVLGCADYHSDAPRGPTVLFEDFDEGLPLEAFLRADTELTFDGRFELVRQLAQALGYCHKRGIIHGTVSPDAILARRDPATGQVELRLFNFQLAKSDATTGTVHGTAFRNETTAIYQAPELREDPSAKTTAVDVFGLGAVAYFIFTGTAPGASLAEVEARLRTEGCLDPRAAEQGVDDKLAEVITVATAYAGADRYDDPLEWWNLLETELTEPELAAPPEQTSPLEAKPGDMLDGDLLVESVLGEGASSRVLRVTRESDDRSYALKVSLNEDQDHRLRAEAEVMGKLRHPRIAQLVDSRVIGDRVCLLLGLAGSRTLQRELAVEGTVSLEYAARYGEDLLTALELLQDEVIVHRDIKPANLGVGTASKQTNHLVLFDFSLAAEPLNALGIGTALYRDPFLADRRQWDASADHYSAAVTLHEMLTGVRARWGSDQLPAHDERATLQLAAASFDPALRDQLVAFFQQALARKVEDRFDSAAAMRKAWERAFEEPKQRATDKPPKEATSGESATATAAAITDISLDSPLDALPLSPRAKNALDRAGVAVAGQVLALPDNRLSAIRGSGRKVQREIHDFREALKQHHGSGPAPTDHEPFYPGYRGEPRPLTATELDPAISACLQDAGLRNLTAVAAAPKQQVVALLKRVGASPKPLRAYLEQEQRTLDLREHPTTLEEWIDALLPSGKSKRREYLECLLGLREPFAGRIDVPVVEVAKHAGVTTANLYIALGKFRESWAQHAAIDELIERASALVASAGGAIPVERGAALLLESLPHHADPGGESRALATARAAALLRIAAEVDHAREGALGYIRIPRRGPWLLDEGIDQAALARLGEAADQFAERDVPASPAEAARKLAGVVAGTALESLPPDQLITLACDAAGRAACSSRLEIYPKGQTPERSLALTAGILKGRLTPEAVDQRVRARYPEAAPLPQRPDLDALLEPLKLYWDADDKRYRRKGETLHTSLATQGASWGSRHITAPTGLPRSESPDALSARDFDEQLRAALEADAFRVLGVAVRSAPIAVNILAERHGLKVHNFDALFIAELKKLTASGKPSLEKVLETDGAGADHPQWKFLRKLADRAAESVVTALAPAEEPCLITQLSLTHRYGMIDALRKLVEGAQDSRSRSVFLLVPCPETAGTPRIENHQAIPALLPGQSLWIPGAWLKNAHNAAA